MELNPSMKVALEQLEVALKQFQLGNFFAAITLAGAADEIMGKVCRELNVQSSLETLQRAQVLYNQIIRPNHKIDEKKLKKRVADNANYAKNKTKHINAILEPTVDFEPDEEARDLINRALDNWWSLGQPFTPEMSSFYKKNMNV